MKMYFQKSFLSDTCPSPTRSPLIKRNENKMNKERTGNGTDFDCREEEFRKLNDQLETKRGNILRKAVELFENHEKFMQRPVKLSTTHKDSINSATCVSSTVKIKVAKQQESLMRPQTAPNDKGLYPKKTFCKQNEEELEASSEEDHSVSEDDHTVFSSTRQMTSETQLRFLRAQVKALQEELKKTYNDLKIKDSNLRTSQSKFKESEENRVKLQKVTSTIENHSEKLKKMNDGLKETNASLEAQLLASKKELESMRKLERQKNVWHTNQDVKINRAIEECNKYKSQLDHLQAEMKEAQESDRKLIGELVASKKNLEKEKNDLSEVVKKQLKLINVCKRQQIHTEAAKILFTEEELAQIFEWKKTSHNPN